MKTFQKQALGTIIEIQIKDTHTHQSDIDECFGVIENFEQKYSRFIEGNLLWKINTSGTADITPELLYMVHTAKQIYTETKGGFDITLLPVLENAGYGISSAKIPENIGTQHIHIDNDMITLKNGVKIDFGSMGKGYMLDTIYQILEKKYTDFTLNFGGDIRIKGNATIGLEDPLRQGIMIGEITVSNRAFAASSGNRRKLKQGHHIINPTSLQSPQDKIALYTTHPLGIYADAYSTALFSCPIEQSLDLIQCIPELEALIISQDGKIFSSPGFNSYLKLY